MHAPEIICLNFNPEESEDEKIREIFRNRIARILWCCLRNNHVTDQYFNNIVLEVTEEINDSLTYDDFLKRAAKLTKLYGRCTVDEGSRIDNEFWGDVFKAIKGKRCFQYKQVKEEEIEEAYPPGWKHCTIHLNPETGEMHSDGDHSVREWIQDRLISPDIAVASREKIENLTHKIKLALGEIHELKTD